MYTYIAQDYQHFIGPSRSLLRSFKQIMPQVPSFVNGKNVFEMGDPAKDG